MDIQYVMNIAPEEYRGVVIASLRNGCTKESLYQLFQQGTISQFEKLTNSTTPLELSELIYYGQKERREAEQ